MAYTLTRFSNFFLLLQPNSHICRWIFHCSIDYLPLILDYFHNYTYIRGDNVKRSSAFPCMLRANSSQTAVSQETLIRVLSVCLCCAFIFFFVRSRFLNADNNKYFSLNVIFLFAHLFLSYSSHFTK